MIPTIIFDWKRTLFNPDTQQLLPNTKKVMASLHRQHMNLVLIGKGDPSLADDVQRLGLSSYFSDVLFTGNKKDIIMFAPFVKNPKQTYVVGDRVRGEIKIGNQLGAITIWIKQGKFAHELPLAADEIPQITIRRIQELESVLVDAAKR